MSEAKANLCWGFKYQGGTEFPWTKEGGGGELDWWREENNFPGQTGEMATEEVFDEKFPIPFETVRVCSWDDDIFILACPEMLMETGGDLVLQVSPSEMMVAKKGHERNRIQKFRDFIGELRKRGIDPENNQKDGQWFLSAFYDE